ncbi:isoprenylcysteine carboxylmethyltransferase family protein [Deinococcus sp. SDU3-2]|uniref:Isoprenylcysteine carboxylmethyltransferase family protein n=2 Tax=Deinococcus terrestris TaxID=2651870 RepID=A0A7X1NZN0_9DEIO|nr:methyltransferase [Deinococcus sp. NW-56]MPY68271.1 isoprenylcysteine carboxylmethyltransferase family protein [Deinococcus terrestris]
MTEHGPNAALLTYFVAYLVIVFGWRSMTVWRATGINPYVLPRDDSAPGYIGRAMRSVLLALLLVTLGLTLQPSLAAALGPVQFLQQAWTGALGWVLLLGSLVWITAAQISMGPSWRVGIDPGTPAALVQRGLFRVSRNPIFLGMRLTLLGLLLVEPNAVTVAALVAGELLMQVQVRLEEAHLETVHGETYRLYRQQVRRWL